MSRDLQYVFCGDDFTGASDTLATLARAGLRCRLFLSPAAIRDCSSLGELDAVGIATAARSMKPPDIVAKLTPIGEMLAEINARFFHYKVCSTFDSSPETGSIGAAVNTIKRFLPDARIMIVGGQPSLRRYCVFSNLFAAAGDGQIYRLDMHPTMANHPVTPMSEADLRQILVAQGLEPIGGIHLHTYNYGIASVRQAVESLHADNKAVLFDVHHQSDLALIGQFMHEQRAEKILAVGPSSVAEAYLSGNLSRACTLSPHRPSLPRKPVFILAGSRSQVTASQVEKAQGFVKLYIHPADLEHDRGAMLTMMSARCLKQLGQGNHVLAIVSNDMKHSLSRVDLAYFTADLISKIAFSGQVDRLGIAGGDTSSLALQRLGMKSLSYTADIEPGLCLCRLHSTDKPAIDGLEIVLKGGQMGSSDLFTKLTGLL